MNARKPGIKPMLFVIVYLLVVFVVLFNLVPLGGNIKVSKTGKVLDVDRNELGDAEVMIEGRYTFYAMNLLYADRFDGKMLITGESGVQLDGETVFISFGKGLNIGKRRGTVDELANNTIVPWGSIDARPFLKEGDIFLYDENCFVSF